MQRVRSNLMLAASISALAAGLLARPAAAQPAAAPERDGTRIEEIVVTAQKRQERLQDVPISITAFSEQAIADNRIQNVTDLSGLAPNLTVRPQTGSVASPIYSMRGIVGTGALPGQDKGISLYVDGVYMSANVGSIFDLADIQRIEVLKGPQGTLFGRNATGGAISLVTRNPSGEFGVQQALTVGNFNQFRSRTHVDFPSMGDLSASVSYLHTERRGDIRNLGAGTRWDYGPATGGQFGVRTSPKYLGDNNTDAVAATIRFNPGDSLDVAYKFDYTDNHYTENGQALLAAGDPLFSGQFAAALIALQPPQNAAILTPFTSKRPDAVNAAFTTPGHAVNYGHNLTLSYVVNDVISLKNILAYRSTTNVGTSDVSGAGGLVTTPAILSLLGITDAATRGFLQNQPFLVYGITNKYKQRQMSNETQVNVNLERLKFTGGFFTFDERINNVGFNNVSSTIFFTPVPQFVIPASGAKGSITHIKSNAIFGQAEFTLLDGLTAVGGLRQTWDHKYGADYTTPARPILFDLKQNKLTWLAGLNYKPNVDMLIYGKASTGFISGGQYKGLAYRPESALSYEVGVKADLFDRRLRANLAIFNVTYDDLQFLVATATGVAVANSGKARARGGEFEGTYVPLDGLSLTAGLGYLDFKYLSLAPGVGNIKNYRPDNRPKITGTLAANYEGPTTAWGGKFVARVDGQYTSKVNGVPAPPASARSAETFPSHWLLNARIGVASIPIKGSKIGVSVWGRNLTDNKSPIYSADLKFIYSAVYQQARTFGVDVNLEF